MADETARHVFIIVCGIKMLLDKCGVMRAVTTFVKSENLLVREPFEQMDGIVGTSCLIAPLR